MAMTREELERAKTEGRRVQYHDDYLNRTKICTVVEVDAKERYGLSYHSEEPIAELHDGRILAPGGYEIRSWAELEWAPPRISRLSVSFDLDLNEDVLRNLPEVKIPSRPILGPDFEAYVRDYLYKELDDLAKGHRGGINPSSLEVKPGRKSR